jgi:hypothetical protein
MCRLFVRGWLRSSLRERSASLKINQPAMLSQSPIAQPVDYLLRMPHSNAQSDQQNDYSALAHEVDYL